MLRLFSIGLTREFHVKVEHFEFSHGSLINDIFLLFFRFFRGRGVPGILKALTWNFHVKAVKENFGDLF